MIIVNLKGGLGNQMFQYVLGWVIAKKNKTSLGVDLRFYSEYNSLASNGYTPREYSLDIFGISPRTPSYASLLLTRMHSKQHRIREGIAKSNHPLNSLSIYEDSRVFNEAVLSIKSKFLYLDGYWQTEKYFKNYRNEILTLYNFKSLDQSINNGDILRDINDGASICLHIRRGDFIGNPEHDCVDNQYYQRAISHIRKEINSEIKLFIFSDDPEWCRANKEKLGTNVFVVGEDYAGHKGLNHLYLMAQFKYFIISNSTFAWWGAWLSQKSNKVVIAPQKWSGFTVASEIDIVPENWIQI